jgi:hypothetical protein
MGKFLTAIILAASLMISAAMAQTPALINVTTLASGVTTNTTTVAKPLPKDLRSLHGSVICTSGACTQTQAIFGDINNDSANGILLCTITLSGTPRDDDACPPMTAVFNYYYVTTTNTTGTAAAGAVYAMY